MFILLYLGLCRIFSVITWSPSALRGRQRRTGSPAPPSARPGTAGPRPRALPPGRPGAARRAQPRAPSGAVASVPRDACDPGALAHADRETQVAGMEAPSPPRPARPGPGAGRAAPAPRPREPVVGLRAYPGRAAQAGRTCRCDVGTAHPAQARPGTGSPLGPDLGRALEGPGQERWDAWRCAPRNTVGGGDLLAELSGGAQRTPDGTIGADDVPRLGHSPCRLAPFSVAGQWPCGSCPYRRWRGPTVPHCVGSGNRPPRRR